MERIITTMTPPLDADRIQHLINASLDDDKAEDITTLPISDKCSFADYMVVATGRSQRHVSSIALHVIDKLKEVGMPPLSAEGLDNGDWVLIDAGDVVVHIFRSEVREFYNIEKMWAIPVAAQQEAVM